MSSAILRGLAPCILFLAGRGRASGTPPASRHCEDGGGSEVDRYTADGGRYTLCVFDDSACDTWMFYGGACARGSTELFADSCFAHGGEVVQRSVKWGDLNGPASAKYYLCAWRGDRKDCEEYFHYYGGGCGSYEGEKGIASHENLSKATE